MAYLLDANVFIQAKNLHYGLDFCPAFWDWPALHNPRADRTLAKDNAERGSAGRISRG